MKVYVIDASVAAKWSLPPAEERFAEEALELLRRYKTGEVQFIVPDLFWAELANVLWNAARRGRITRAAAEIALFSAQEEQFSTVSSQTLLGEAFTIAATFDRPVYDSLYVALAIISKTTFITADEKLANAVSARLPVKLLGSA